MTVSDVNTISAEGGFDEQGYRTWRVIQEAFTTARQDGPITVLTDARVPQFLDAFQFGNDYDYGARCIKRSAVLKSAEQSSRAWTVTLEYSSKPLSRPPQESLIDDPLLLPAEVSGDFVKAQEPLTKDKDGNPADNSAGDLFEGLVKDTNYRTLNIAKNFARVPDDIDDFMNAVNSTTFFGLSARKWKLDSVKIAEQYHGNRTPFYRLTFEFTSNPNTWDFMPADRGWRYKVSGNWAKWKEDTTGLDMGGLFYLDGSGGKRGNSDPVVYFDGLSGNPNPIRGYNEKDFAELGIPTDWGQQ